jgi:hypothetical protein
MKENILEFIKKNPTVALTILSALSYYCTFQYEKGVCSYYKIPENYIEIGIPNILVFASLIIILCACIIGIGNALIWELPEYFNSRPMIKALVRYNAATMILILIVFSLVGVRWAAVSGVLFVAVLQNLIIYFRFKKPRNEAITNNNDSKFFNPQIYVIVSLIIAIPIFTENFGYHQTERITNYRVLQENKNVVVLKKYGDTFYLRDFKKNRLGKKLMIIKQSPQFPLLLIDTTMMLKVEE